MMETKAANGEKIPEQWKVSLSEIDAKLRGDSVGEHVFSLVVEGHPMFDGFPILRNLVPIKVDSFSEAERKLFSAQDLYSKIAGERAKAAHAKAIAKTVAQKKAAIAAMQKLDNNGATEDAVETLRSVTIPELQRIAKEAEQKFGAGNVANEKAKESATKADTKSIAIPDTQELVRRLGVYEKTFSDLVDVKYANLNDPESFAHKDALFLSGLTGSGLLRARVAAGKFATEKPGIVLERNDKTKPTNAAEAIAIAARAPEVASLADRLKAAAATAVGSRKAALEERLVRLEAAPWYTSTQLWLAWWVLM